MIINSKIIKIIFSKNYNSQINFLKILKFNYEKN